MIQVYFLSIFFNGLAGYFLISNPDEGPIEIRSKTFLSFIKDDTFKLILGILTIITGLLKLLSPVEGDIPVIGDLVPAITGFAVGFVLVYEHYKTRSLDSAEEESENLSTLLISNRKIVGIAAIVVSLLHFLFPKALFL